MRATEPLAFASLITAVLAIMLVCCCGFLSVPLAGLAILLGVISLVRIQLDPLTYEGKVPTKKRPAFSVKALPLAGGGFATTPLGAWSSTRWLRDLLIDGGIVRAQVMEYGTHSCKATRLGI